MFFVYIAMILQRYAFISDYRTFYSYFMKNQQTDDRKKLIGDESKLLEDHRKENKEILTRHFYDMSNMMSRNEGVWLSNGWVKTLLWIFLLCFLYMVISIAYFVASYIDK